jgi:predicted nucleotidyltransferase
MTLADRFDLTPREVEEFCRERHIRHLALFGSVLGEAFGPDSDVDVLIEFEPGHQIGFLGMARIERELTERMGRPVDLRTPAELSRYFRDEVLRQAKTLYAA